MQQGKALSLETAFRPIDLAFGKYIASLAEAHQHDMQHLAAQCSFDTSQGHVCTHLEVEPPPHKSISDACHADTPLVYFENSLYLQRHFIAERFLHEALFINNPEQPLATPIETPLPKESEQRQAIINAMRYRISAISGAPGTGKSTLIATLAKRFSDQEKRIALCAPTGKAASRLNQALNHHQLSLQTVTIERLLGTNPNNHHQRYNAESLLPIDVLIIDEAAMVDNQRLDQLIRATPLSAHIIMAGDHQQLPAIESGQVMQALFDEQLPLPRFCTRLTTNYRFAQDTPLGQLALTIESASQRQLTHLLDAHPTLLVNKTEALNHALEQTRAYHQTIAALELASQTEKALQTFSTFQVLTAMRQGSEGSQAINTWIHQQLGHAPNQLAAGTPIIITQNTPWLELFNGDIGIVSKNTEHVYFMDEEKPRKISRLNLPPHELAYALTVHKAQGSEFDEVLCLFSATNKTLLSKALLYTAITRARKETRLICDEQTLQFALTNQIVRQQNLRKPHPCN